MASIDKRPTGQWRARWREYPGGPQKTKQFATKNVAERWLDANVRGPLAQGAYVDPKAGQVTFRAFAEEWRAMQPHRESTATNVEQDLRLHIYPSLGNRPIASIRPSHVQAAVTAMTVAPSTAVRIYGRITAVFRAAVRDRVVASSPCIDIRVPRGRSTAITEVLTVEQVLALAGAVPARYRAAIVTAAGTGLRPGELFGLTIDAVEFLRRQMKVEQQLAYKRGAGVGLAPLKTPGSYRTIPLATVVLDALAEHIERWPAHSGLGLIFTNLRGAPIQQSPFGSMFETAKVKAKVPDWATPHDLRHHHASVLLSAGVNPAKVAERLGHDLKTLLTTYAHSMPKDDDRVRDVVDASLGGAAEDFLRTSQAQ